MKKFVLKVIFVVLIVYIPIIVINYNIDPANLYNTELIDNVVRCLLDGEIIESPGDMDEANFQKQMISSMHNKPGTVIIGSSHVMYIPWEYDDYYVAGLSGAYLGDYYAIVGLLDSYDKMPSRIVFGVDPWAFMTKYDNGRHEEIKSFAVQEYNLVNDVGEVIQVGNRSNISKMKEMLSFPYFQSSFKYLRKNGISYYLNGLQKNVSIGTDKSTTNVDKIMPNGLRIMSLNVYHSVEKNRATAQSAINSRNIYQLQGEMSSINNNNFDDFVSLIRYLQSRGIEIELYLPSWYPTLYAYFESSTSYSGVMKVEEMIRDVGKQYGFIIHGSYNPTIGQVYEEDFADWLHLKPEKMLDNYNVVLD